MQKMNLFALSKVQTLASDVAGCWQLKEESFGFFLAFLRTFQYRRPELSSSLSHLDSGESKSERKGTTNHRCLFDAFDQGRQNDQVKEETRPHNSDE